MYRVSPFLRNFGLSLLAGVGLASLWVNLAPASYYDAAERVLFDLALPVWISPQPIGLSLIGLVSDGLMALFLFMVGKELWEAMVLERGALRGPRSGAALFGLVGGTGGAVLMWVLLEALWQTAEEAAPGAGWAVPVGSDVVLAWLMGRMVFGRGHPALHVLLLLTVGSNILGLLLLGVAAPRGGIYLLWLLLPLGASLGVWLAFGHLPRGKVSERRMQRAFHLWPYMAAGAVSWFGVAASGLPPALGLLPVLPAIPHADHAFGVFAEAEEFLQDPLNRLAHLAMRPMLLILFLFGLTRGGIDLAAFAPTTTILLGAVWLGKPLGIVLGALVVARALGHRLPAGVRRRDMVLVALLAGMCFTIPVLGLDSALPGGAVQEAARLGLALSLLAGPLAVLAARLWPAQGR